MHNSSHSGVSAVVKVKRYVTKVPKYGNVISSKHFVERWMKRISKLGSQGVTKDELDQVFWNILKKAKTHISIFKKKSRFTSIVGNLELLIVVAPTRNGNGLELVTVWSPTHNSKEEQGF